MANHLHCATCGTKTKLTGQIVTCSKCRVSGTLEAAMLTISAQAHERGVVYNPQSIRADSFGDLIYDLIPTRKSRMAKRRDTA